MFTLCLPHCRYRLFAADYVFAAMMPLCHADAAPLMTLMLIAYIFFMMPRFADDTRRAAAFSFAPIFIGFAVVYLMFRFRYCLRYTCASRAILIRLL